MDDVLSQDELDALFNSVATDDSADDNALSDYEKDVLGEIGNISMGTSATTLFALLNNKVNITTPHVDVTSYKKILTSRPAPYVATRVDYRIGLVGTNVLVLTQKDVKIIASLMMGGDGLNIDEAAELTEIDLSAISEAMNQMIGSASTSMASMIDMKIDINPPVAFVIDNDNTDEELFEKLGVSGDEDIVSISFKMVIGELIDSTLIQVLPLKFAKELVEMANSKNKEDTGDSSKNDVQKDETVDTPIQNNVQKEEAKQANDTVVNDASVPQNNTMNFNNNVVNPTGNVVNSRDVDVRPVQFQNFNVQEVMQQKENISIIMDVPLEVTVELGRTTKPIKEILEFTPGTIVELNKLAGEPIDILVNGKFIANGEVVVIDENFGIRITGIVSVENRI